LAHLQGRGIGPFGNQKRRGAPTLRAYPRPNPAAPIAVLTAPSVITDRPHSVLSPNPLQDRPLPSMRDTAAQGANVGGGASCPSPTICAPSPPPPQGLSFPPERQAGLLLLTSRVPKGGREGPIQQFMTVSSL